MESIVENALLVSLARAIYSRASVLVLDDIISAVDAQTSRHIVQECFTSKLAGGRTIIIASHAVEAMAPLAQHSILLDDGRAVWSGSGKALLESEHMTHLKAEDFTESLLSAEDEENTGRQDGLQVHQLEIRDAIAKTPKQLVIEEKRNKGNVDLHHWWTLKRANGGKSFWIGMVLLLLLSGVAPVVERGVLE